MSVAPAFQPTQADRARRQQESDLSQRIALWLAAMRGWQQ
jgi:hypothetical protein